MFNKILVALDQSATSQQVFDAAIALAQANHAELMLLHVMPAFGDGYSENPVYPGPDSCYPVMHTQALKYHTEQWERSERQGLEVLQSLVSRANQAGVVADFTQAIGDASRGICNVAQNWNADLIIVGRRGLSAVNEFFLGSVSNYVLHHAPCSVLIVQSVPTAPTEPSQSAVAVNC